MEGALFAIDRGYMLLDNVRTMDATNCKFLGTCQRTHDHPYTFGHPDQRNNVPDEGPPAELCTKKSGQTGTAVRDWQGNNVVLLKTNMDGWAAPPSGPLCIPVAPAGESQNAPVDRRVFDSDDSERPCR